MEPLSATDPRMIGEFRLHARLGAGGMGQVYLGFSPAGRAVAIKVVHAQYAADPEFLRRFSHEVTAARAVSGMYTAAVVDASIRDDSPWLATAYVPGPPLAAVVAKYGPLPEAAVWRLAAGLAEALRAVHAAGVIHRDLKPANVLLADDGPHLIDFGISRPFHGTQLTSTGMVIGTPGYMSPEQVQSQPAGPASDIFSLGCVLAYAAAGNPPFAADNPASLLFQIVSAEPNLGAVPPRLRQVIDACLQKDPAQRPVPAQLVAMISALGPGTPATLGSFWPEDVARVIAGEQSSQTPAGLTPPGPVSAPVEWAPTATAMPASGQGLTGHAPMLSDGYYAAAAQGSAAPVAAPPGPSIPPLSPPPQSHAAPQQYAAPQPGGQPPPGQAPGGQAAFGQAVFGQPGLGTAAPQQAPSYPGQAPSYPPQYPGQQPSGADALARYAPGRRKPARAEIPAAVRTAIRLMYAGCAVTALNALLSLPVLRRSAHNAHVASDASARALEIKQAARTARESAVFQAQAARESAVSQAQGEMAAVMTVVLAADLVGLVCWVWLAAATRRGRGWPRIAGLALVCAYTVIMLMVVAGTANDPGAKITTFLVWALGLATVIPLWSRQAREFFSAWRRR